MCFSPRFVAAIACAVLVSPVAADTRLATDWNTEVLSLAEAEDGFLTLKGLRTVAMVHLAMHDALQSGVGNYATYSDIEPPAPNVARPRAANAAAYAIAAKQYPNERVRLDQLRRRWDSELGGDSHGASDDYGQTVAATILNMRAGDGWDGEAEYRWHPMAPGVYAEFAEHSGTPEGFIFGAGWANARGFALTAPDQFRSAAPPAIDSEAYTIAFNEVKSFGRFQSMDRTADQTHIALWWKDFVDNSHNRLARQLIAAEQLPLAEAARVLALMNMAVFDAYVASFDNKFHYNHWRPFTAIRWADNDGNSDTVADPTWNNTHRHTYAFPSYPSAHGTACAAAMTALESVFGTDYRFTMVTAAVDIAAPFSGKLAMEPPTRTFDSFAAAATECALSRVFLGIHFRYDSEAGEVLGKQVGHNVLVKRLQALASGN
ncbi:MAG: vanadium-dependent haloperoxidase [Pseudomonadota bacterium]